MRFRESSSESLCRWAATCSGVRSFRAVAGACAAACCSSIDLLSQPRATNVDYTQWAITLTGETVWGSSFTVNPVRNTNPLSSGELGLFFAAWSQVRVKRVSLWVVVMRLWGWRFRCLEPDSLGAD